MKTTLILTAIIACSSLSHGEDGPKPDRKRLKQAILQEMKQRDTNNDGSVSKQEFIDGAKDPARAEKIFARLDRNGDGAISKEDRVEKEE